MNRDNMDMAGITIGYAPCMCCGNENLPVKVNSKGHLYQYCTAPADGGCGGGWQGRSIVSDGKIASRVTKWAKPEYRSRLKVAAPMPAEAKPADEAPVDDEDDVPTPAAVQQPEKPAGSWFDKPLF